MKKRVLPISIIAILIIAMLTGCGNQSVEETYNEGLSDSVISEEMENDITEEPKEEVEVEVEESAGDTVEEPARETVEESAEEVVEESVGEAAEETTEEFVEEVTEETIKESTDEKPVNGEVIASGTLANDSIEWQIVGSTLYVRGEGGIPPFDEGIKWIEQWGAENGVTAKAWQIYYGVVNEIVIEEGITSVGSFNFEGFANATKLTLPSTLESVGRYAFSGVGATTLNLPGSLKTASHGAFSNMQNLTYLFVPSNLKSIPSYGFANCYKLTKIEIEEGVTSIGEDAFCSLAYYDLEGVRHGGNYGYEIHVPSSVTYIGDYAFATGDTHGPITVYGKAGSYVEGWVKDVNIQPEVVFVAK